MRHMPTDDDALLGRYINEVRQKVTGLGAAEERALSGPAGENDEEAVRRIVGHHLLGAALLALELAPASAPPLDAIQEANLVLRRVVEQGLSGSEVRSALEDQIPTLFARIWPDQGQEP